MNQSVSQISAILNPKLDIPSNFNESPSNNQSHKPKDSTYNLTQLLNVEPLKETLKKHKRFSEFVIPKLILSDILVGDNNTSGEPILLDVFRTQHATPKHLEKLLTHKPGKKVKHRSNVAESDSECDSIAIGSKRRKLRAPDNDKVQSKIPVVLDSSKYLYPNPTLHVSGHHQPTSDFHSKKRTSESIANSYIALPELGYVDFCPEINLKYIRKILQNHHSTKASEGTKFPFQGNDLDFLFSYEQREDLDADETFPVKYFDYQHKEVQAVKTIPTIPTSVDAPVTDYFKALWASIVHQEMPQKFRSYTSHRQRRLNGLATLATDVQDRVRRMVADKIKSPKEIQNRGRKLLKETAAYWRRYDKDAKENKKRNEKLEVERRKKEEEMREAIRQQNKLNFLLQQTELFTHFIARKYNPAESVSSGNTDDIKLSVEVDYNQEGMISKADAMKMTEQAVNKQMMRLQQFDNDVHALRGAPTAKSNTLEEPSIQQPSILKGQLKAYQLKGLSWLVNLYDHGINGILADEMGLGKTIQSIAFLAHLAEAKDIWGPFLIIAPVSTLHNWQQEIAKFCPTLKVLPYWGTAKERQVLRKFWNPKNLYHKNAAFHVLITSYGLILQDEKYFQRMKWQNMIIDEAQALKSSNSARWHILLNFNCRNRMLLTGTPIQNNMTELWALLHFIMPTLFDSHDEFNEWFSKDIENHATAQTQLNAHQLSRLHLILKPFMLRRTKLDVEQEIAKKIELEVPCFLTARQRKLYKAIKDKISIADLLHKSQSDVSQLLNLVMQFRKVCNHPEIFERSAETSPYQWEDYHNYLDTSDTNATKFLCVRKHPLLQVVLPKLLYRDGLTMESKRKLLYNTFNIFNNDYIHDSVYRHADSCFSFMRLCDISPAQLTAVSRMNPLELFLVCLVNDARAHQLALRSSIVEPTTILIRNLYGPIQQLTRLLNNSAFNTLVDPNDPQRYHYEHHYKLLTSTLDRMHSLKGMLAATKIFTPKVLAPPAELLVSDRSFANQSEELLKAPFERMLLFGASSSLNEVASQAGKVKSFQHKLAEFEYETLDIFHDARGIMEPIFDVYGSSRIWVPGLAKLLAQSGKLRMLDSMLTRLKKEGHRVLIYSQMTRMLDILEDFMWYRKHRYFRLDGSSKLSDRRDMVDDFQKRNDIFVFLLSTRAGGLGINLTAADTVIFYDSDWNPTIDQQAMDRAHRLGQTKQVTVYRLITKGTVEERILKRAKQKHHIQSIVISGGNFAFQNENDDNLSAKEALSLLLDEDEIEQNVQKQMENRSKKRTRKPKDPSKPKKAKSISFGVRDRVLDAEKEGPLVS